MKKTGMLLAPMLTLCLLAHPVSAAAPGEAEILGETAVLMDAQTGQVLYEKNAHDVRQPASITKIMTAMLALERLESDAVLTASSTAVDIPSWGTSAYIKAGERLTVRDAMYAMMLKSANEAANLLAEAAGGSLSGFAELMNERALELGAQNTHFTNASGLPARNHVTTAYDMALITRQAIQTPGFLEYFGASGYAMPATNRSGARSFTNTHRMLLSEYGVYNEEVIGGKTGYTVPAGYTLVTVARREERTLICVILKSTGYYADTQALLDFGFDEFTPYTYEFEAVEAAEVSIWDGGRETGRAYYSLPASASLLLHEDENPRDLFAEYQLPDRLEPDEIPQADVSVFLSGRSGGLPNPVLTLPMAVEIAALAPPAEPAAETVTAQPPGDAAMEAAPAAFVLAAASSIVCAAIILKSRRRRRRQNRLYRNRGRLYHSPHL